jgi:hypothetical protein
MGEIGYAAQPDDYHAGKESASAFTRYIWPNMAYVISNK